MRLDHGPQRQLLQVPQLRLHKWMFLIRHILEYSVAKETDLAKNLDKTDGHLDGAVKARSQFVRPDGHPVERDTTTGQFVNVKHDKVAFKGVRREKH
jgi:hypothetical protein